MKGWLLFWVALIGLGFTISTVEDAFGSKAGDWVGGTGIIVITISVLVARSLHKRRIEEVVHELVGRHDRGREGAFCRWFKRKSEANPDRVRVSSAARMLLKAYGGPKVVRQLADEGFSQVLMDDLCDVFGEDRAGLILFEGIGLANRPGFLSGTLLPVGLGAVIGYHMTSRR